MKMEQEIEASQALIEETWYGAIQRSRGSEKRGKTS